MKYLVLGLVTLLLVGCSQEQPMTYEVPKEQNAAPVRQMGTDDANASVITSHNAMSAGTAETGYTAALPDGWTEKAGSGMRMASYAIEGTSIDFYLISLSMGDVPSNVNRWRGQVGLPVASPEEIADDTETFDADGKTVQYIEIYNEEDGKGIIAAIIDLMPKYWYFTAKGSVEELKANAAEIRAFLESLQFE